jgi:hypothetical protein
MAREWFGMDIEAKINRASGRAIIAIGVNVASETKRITHRISGTLARSIHVAEVGYEQGDTDEGLAESGDLLFQLMPASATHTEFGPAIEVGSWLPYACVEWVGRQHPGITQGLEAARSRADAIVEQAFMEEGL